MCTVSFQIPATKPLNLTPVPSKPSDLTVNGLKAYNSDYDFYKGQLEHYKILDRKHE